MGRSGGARRGTEARCAAGSSLRDLDLEPLLLAFLAELSVCEDARAAGPAADPSHPPQPGEQALDPSR